VWSPLPQYGGVEIRELRQSDGDELRALWRARGIHDRPGDDDASLAAGIGYRHEKTVEYAKELVAE